jgi:hypothetical protein
MIPMRGPKGTLLSLFLALAGQAFLSQCQWAWSLPVGFLFYGAALYLFLSVPSIPTGKEEVLPPRLEAGALAALAGLALFSHLFQLSRIPPGMTVEETCGPWLGYAIPPSQWAMYYPMATAHTYADLTALSWVWFHLFTPSRASFSFFYAFFSLLAFPLGYVLFRGLAGARTALWALFLWMVQQWPLTLGRAGHASVTALLFTLGTLTFGHLALTRGRAWQWILAGAFAGCGLYSHPGFRPALLLSFLWLAWEWKKDPGEVKTRLRGLGAGTLVFLMLSFPCLASMAATGDWLTGSPKDGQWVLSAKNLGALWEGGLQGILAFYREGSAIPQENLPGHRLLDDATAVLATLGFFLALGRPQERKFFYGFTGASILSFSCLLSTQPLHASRMLGVAPFLAYLAALALEDIGQRAVSFRGSPRWILGLGLLVGLVAAGENFKTYFLDRPRNEACWLEAGVDDTSVGESIARDGDRYEYYLSPTFYQRFQVLFLGHAQVPHMHPLDLPGDFGYLKPPPGRGLCFVVQEGRTGVLSVLQKRWPGGVTEKLIDPWGRPYLYIFRVPPEACAEDRFVPLPHRRYWEGTYRTSLAPGAKPVLTVADPVLNFSYRDDFPVKNADRLWVEWHGTLHPPKAGTYWFLLATSDEDHAQMDLEGKPFAVSNQDARVELKARDYAVAIYLLKTGGFDSVFHLVWKPPGSGHFEVLPPDVMR